MPMKKFRKPLPSVVLDDSWPPQAKPRALNQVLIELTAHYKAEMPGLLLPGVTSARKFIVEEITPMILGLTNGVQDGLEIIKNVFDEEPQASEVVATVNHFMKDAMRAKIACYVAKHCRLDANELRMYLFTSFAADNNSDMRELIESIVKVNANNGQKELPPMQKIPNVRRPKKEPALRVRRVRNSKATPT